MGGVALGLMVLSYAGPWWVEAAPGWTAGFGLLRYTHTQATHFSPAGPNETITTSTDYSHFPATGSVLFLASVLLAAGIAAGVCALALPALKMARPRYQKWGTVSGVIAAGLATASSLYVMVELPGAWILDFTEPSINQLYGTPSTAFWGSLTCNPEFNGCSSGSPTFAAGWGWYLPLVAAAAFLVAVAFQRRAGTREPPPDGPS